MSAIAIIPARGGSKRIPGKNIKLFAGKPMIAWSIAAARQSGVFDEVIVSTDDEAIAAVAREHGASVPFVRPPDISGDTAGLNAVLRHALSWLKHERGALPELLGCVYATAPFLQASDLRAAADLLQQRPEAEYAISVCTFPSPVQRAITADAAGHLTFLWPDLRLLPSQQLAEAYHDAGQFVLGRSASFLVQDSALMGRCLPLVIPRHRCQDIDTEEDWQQATLLFSLLHRESLAGGQAQA